MKKLQANHLRDFKHPLVSRRDFLTHGLISFGALATFPIFGSKIQSWATKPLDGASSSVPFMAFDMAGGGSLHGNFLPGKTGGPEDLLASYNVLGWDPRESGSLNTDFGLPMSAKYSKILAGILQTASATTRANLRMGSFCHNVAAFDSQSNNLNSGILVLKAGAKGNFISNGAGDVDSESGGNSAAIQQAPAFKPVVVNGINDLLRSVSFGGPGNSGLSVPQLQALAQAGIDLSAVQIKDYSNLPGGFALENATGDSYSQSLKFLSNLQGLDPRQDTIAQTIYQITAQTDAADPNAVAAGLALNTINGNCGPSTWTLGNCDYHTGNGADGDAQDLAMGQQIGRALEYASQKQQPLFFQLITDGSCTADTSTRNWNADSFYNMTIIGYFNPKAPPKYIMDGNSPRLQIGSYTDAQGPDTTTLIGNSSDLVAYAVFANYLNVCNRIGEFNSYAPNIFTNQQLDSVLIFDVGAST